MLLTQCHLCIPGRSVPLPCDYIWRALRSWWIGFSSLFPLWQTQIWEWKLYLAMKLQHFTTYREKKKKPAHFLFICKVSFMHCMFCLAYLKPFFAKKGENKNYNQPYQEEDIKSMVIHIPIHIPVGETTDISLLMTQISYQMWKPLLYSYVAPHAGNTDRRGRTRISLLSLKPVVNSTFSRTQSRKLISALDVSSWGRKREGNADKI